LNLGHFHGIYYHSEKIWLTDIYILVMVLFLSIDPFILVISIIFGTRSTKKIAQYKVPDHILSDETFRRKEFLSVAIIIACHKSNDVIERTVRAALDHFPPQNIYVADNGNSPVPLDDTEQIVLEIDPMINYRWSSMGNKTLAQFLSVNTIMERDDIKHVMIVDDDTKFPKNFKTYSEEINHVTKGVMFAIRGVEKDGSQDCVWTKWQDLEYKLGDLVKEIQCKYATVLFPHGAVSLWGKETLFEILGNHDTIFYADDVKMGIYLMLNGYRLYYNKDVIFDTIVPSSIVGESPNYYNQRVRSWDFSEHMCTYLHLKHTLFGYVRESWTRTVCMRVFQLYVLVSILNDWVKIPLLFVYLGHRPGFFIGMVLLNIVTVIVCILVWNYWTCRGQNEIQVDLIAILTFPIYKMISSIARILSVFHCVFIYWPNYKYSPCRKPAFIHEEQIEIFNEYNNLGKVRKNPIFNMEEKVEMEEKQVDEMESGCSAGFRITLVESAKILKKQHKIYL